MKKTILTFNILLGACYSLLAQSVVIEPSNSNGNILTKSPNYNYGSLSTVQSDGADLFFRRSEPANGVGTSGTAVGGISTWSNRFQIKAFDNHFLSFGAGGFDRLNIMTNGYVGLNTTAPVRFFHVSGSTILTETADSANVQIGTTNITNAKLVVTNESFQHGVYIDSRQSPGGFGLFVGGQTNLDGHTTITDRLDVAGFTTLTTANINSATVGNLSVTGTLSKASGSFKIDHPLDPENKVLYHSFVESPDMMNIYNGNATTDAKGFATITLPDYFGALNKDFRYQLTTIGTFAQAIVAEKVKENTFVIQTDKPNVEVSWQVTGIRNDAYAKKFRIPNTVDKTEAEKGKYLYPAAFEKQ